MIGISMINILMIRITIILTGWILAGWILAGGFWGEWISDWWISASGFHPGGFQRVDFRCQPPFVINFCDFSKERKLLILATNVEMEKMSYITVKSI